jgi:hypothetical protein
MKHPTIYDCSVLELSVTKSPFGRITPVEPNIDVPFEIRRIYYLYDIPNGAERGGHAHKELKQLIIAASGAFTVILNDGKQKRIVELNRPQFGLYIVPGIWRDLINFSSGAICLVLVSEFYSETDYIRDYSQYINYIDQLASSKS